MAIVAAAGQADGVASASAESHLIKEQLLAYTGDRWAPHTADDYRDAWWHLLPRGIAWNRYEGSNQDLVVQGLCGIWGDPFDTRAVTLLTVETDPRATLEMLPDWERNWGLPDPCVAEPLNIEDRRIALVTKMTMLGGQSRAFFYNVAQTLGYNITIREYAPYMCGVSRCGDTTDLDAAVGGDGHHYRWELGPPENRFYWTIHVDKVRYTPFRASVGQCGVDPLLRISLATDLECIFRRYKPAHTDIVFDYTVPVADYSQLMSLEVY